MNDRKLNILWSVLALVLLANALVAGLRTVSDTDLGWHMATGRYVVEHHSIPTTDVLSFTSQGTPWAYPPFGGVILYLICSKFGYAGLSWFCALACASVLGYLMRGRDRATIALASLAIPAIASRTAPRSDMFSTVLFALFLGELWAYWRGMRKRLIALPVLMLLWVNLHPGFIAGLATIGAYYLLEVCELPFVQRREAAIGRLRKAWPWLLATAGVTLINPFGWRLYENALYLAGMRGAQQGALNSAVYIGEFLGVPLNSQTLYQLIDLRHLENGDSCLILLSFALVAFALWRRQVGAAIILATALYGGLSHARYLALFAITVVTVGGGLLTTELAAMNAAGGKWLGTVRVREALAVALGVLVCGVALLHIADYVSNRSYVVFRAGSRFGAGESSWYPERAAEFIRRNDLPGNVFEEFAVGGFTSWRLGPKYLNYIDGRADRMNPAVFAEQQALMSQSPDGPKWQAAADRWNLNVLLISLGGFRSLERVNPMAFCQSEAWRPVYLDEVSMVLMRNTPQNRPWIDRLQIDCRAQQFVARAGASQAELHDFYINSGALLMALERNAESEQALRRAQEVYPWDPNAAVTLAKLLTREGKLASAEQEFQHSLKLNDNDGAWYELGRIYWMQRKFPQAEDAFQHAIRLSTQPLVLYMNLGQLELILQKPNEALAAYSNAESNSPFRKGGEGQAPDLYAQIAEGRAEAYRMLGQMTRSIEFEQKAVELTPGVGERWERLADLYQLTGQSQLSAQARQRAMTLR